MFLSHRRYQLHFFYPVPVVPIYGRVLLSGLFALYLSFVEGDTDL